MNPCEGLSAVVREESKAAALMLVLCVEMMEPCSRAGVIEQRKHTAGMTLMYELV